MTKETFFEYYKTLSDDDKKHFDDMFILDKIDCGVRAINEKFFDNALYLKHFKRETLDVPNNDTKYIYKLLSVSTHSETKALLVNYEAMYEDESKGIKLFHICSRPIEMFISRVDTNKYPNIKQKYRFEIISIRKNENGDTEFCDINQTKANI